ncbi:MAG TPA: phosphatase PAP2 family protein [Nitrobacter sp.]|nr:phosphatase PAP2 family protein [Nitrobacter sp.]
MGLDWLTWVRWVDRHPAIGGLLAAAYHTMPGQIALPVIVLAVVNRIEDLWIYLVSFALALLVTTIIGALLPALSHIAFVDRANFESLRFSGATPVDHLIALRASGPVLLRGNLGSILSFPSFHATVAVLTPLMLMRYRYIVIPLAVLDLVMFCSTVTEGAHYGCDAIAGGCVAVIAHASVRRTMRRLDQQAVGNHNFDRNAAGLLPRSGTLNATA